MQIKIFIRINLYHLFSKVIDENTNLFRIISKTDLKNTLIIILLLT